LWYGWGGVVWYPDERCSLHPHTTPHHTIPTIPQRNTNTHRTRAIQPMKLLNK